MSLTELQSLESQLNDWQKCLDCLKSNDLTNYLLFELKELQIKIKNEERYEQHLKFNNEVLKYEINKLNNKLSSIKVGQPCYDNIKRITNQIDLKLLSLSIDYDFEQKQNENIYHLIGQIVKKKDLSTMMFIELFIAPSYLIKIAFKKNEFRKEEYNEMRSKCKLGAIIQCNGKTEDYNADKLILIIHKIQLIQLFKRKGFEPYKETNKYKSKNILCSHFIKYFVSKNLNINDIKLNIEFIPKICINSNCEYRHKLLNKNEIIKIMEQFESRNKTLNDEFDENDPFYDSKQSKVARARFFGEWIIKKYGLYNLQQNGILDIAGGGGDLSNILSMEYNIPTTIIDPRKPEKLYKKINKKINKKMKKLNNNNILIPKYIDTYFEWNTLDKNMEIKQIFNECEVVIGLHPDQATEPIVDVSLKYNKKFAILPCCVFPNLYPKYMMINNIKHEVITYIEFVEYLKRKNDSINIDYLPFKGRNKVLYFDGKLTP